MEAKDTLKLISKQWCTLNDLMELAQVGRNYALKLRNEIKVNLENKGYTLPSRLLPMNEVVKYLKININYLQTMANH